MPGCAIASCRNYSNKTKGREIIYHTFPKNPDLLKVWELKCKRRDPINFQNARICSDHFKPDDYERDLMADLMGLPPKKHLKQEAIPSINLPGGLLVSGSESVDIHPTAQQYFSPDRRAERCRQRAVRKRALDSIVHISPKKIKLDKAVSTDTTDPEFERMKKRILQLEVENARLKDECIKLTSRNRYLMKTVSKAQRSLKEISIHKNVNIGKKVEKILSPLFTRNQIRCLETGRKCTKWGKEDICRAITLRAVSRKAYIFLRNKMHYPLPGVSTIKKWVRSSFQCRPGILEDVMHLMRTQAEKLNTLERICVVSFDEMNVDSRSAYDQEEDRIVGPHSNVQVAMARSLFSKWKQPIFFEFDVKMTAVLLKSIISALEGSGYYVVAVVSDLGRKNSGVWNELGVSHLNSCFPNPANPQKWVWVFADVPHLYKLLRNHFLDDGLTLPGEKKLSKEIIEKLLALDKGEIKMCPKLSLQHLTVKGRDRQRVFLAVQLFSNHTAQAIGHLLPGQEHVAEFFKLINDTFDIFNSRIPENENTIASGYGFYENSQEDNLKRLHTCIQGMRVGNCKTLLPFQKGFLMSIRSLLGLFKDMKALAIKYILTARLNQDCLENFFSQIRGMGHFYDHPLPTDVKYRIRLLLVGANASSIPLSSAAPVAECDDSTFITSQLFGGIQPDASIIPDEDDGLGDGSIISVPEGSSKVEAACDVCTAEGLRYIAGYVAHKCRKHEPSLGTPTGQVLPPAKTNGWIEVLSRGGLLVPSESWFAKIEQFELIFAQIHGPHSLNKDSNIIKNLCTKIQENFEEVPAQVIRVYARTRTFIRLRHINAKAKREKSIAAAARKARKWEASKK